MKRLFILMLAAGLLTACGNDEPKDKVKQETKQEEKKETKQESPKVELKLSESKVSFTNVTFEFEKVYMKDDLLILETRFTNDSYDGELSFNTGGFIEVSQNGEQLEEVSGVKEGNKGDYYFKNKAGINTPVRFEYELLNTDDDIKLTIGSNDFTEEAKIITITTQ